MALDVTTPRPLGRSGVSVPPILVHEVHDHGEWLISNYDRSVVAEVVHAEELLRTAPSAGPSASAIFLRGATVSSMKAGRLMDRVQRLRHGSSVPRVLIVEAADLETAEWVVDHTPATAVSLRYRLHDQHAAWSLLDEAATLGTGFVAWEDAADDIHANVAFVLGDPRVASVVVSTALDTTRACCATRDFDAERSSWLAANPPSAKRRRHGSAADE